MSKKETKTKEVKKGCCQLLIWDVPIPLKQKFKSKCAEKNVTMQNTIMDLMNKFSK